MEKESVGLIVPLIIGVFIAVMVLILVGAMGGMTYTNFEDTLDNIGIATESNYLFTNSNVSAVSIGHTLVQNGSLVIQNGTTTIGNGNFTVDYDAGTVLYLFAIYNGSPLNATYQWQNRTITSSIEGGIVESFSALEQTGSYLPIIVLAIVIVIVLGLILVLPGSKGGNAL